MAWSGNENSYSETTVLTAPLCWPSFIFSYLFYFISLNLWTLGCIAWQMNEYLFLSTYPWKQKFEFEFGFLHYCQQIKIILVKILLFNFKIFLIFIFANLFAFYRANVIT